MDENQHHLEEEKEIEDQGGKPPDTIGVYDRPEGPRFSPLIIIALVVLVLIGIFILFQLVI